MLLELAVGDAYGAGFEYSSDRMVRDENDLAHYRQHPRHATTPGQYTDDTQMSLAIAEAIISGEDWTPLNLASRFVDVYKRDPRDGYAGGFAEFLKSVGSGQEFLDGIVPTSDKSGAAMRAVPIGVYKDEKQVAYRATVQAKITHDTVDGVNAAVAVALMAHYALYRHGPISGIATYLDERVPGNWAEPWTGKVGAKGWMSVRAAITTLRSFSRMSDILRACIAYTGDVDTVATIALGVASCSAEVEQDIPDSLLAGLENGAFGRDYLMKLDRQLQLFVTNGAPPALTGRE